MDNDYERWLEAQEVHSYIEKIIEGFTALTLLELTFPGGLRSVSGKGHDTTDVILRYRTPPPKRLRSVCEALHFSKAGKSSSAHGATQLTWDAGAFPVARFFEDIHNYIVLHSFNDISVDGRTYGEAYLDTMARYLKQWGYRNTKNVSRRSSVEKAIKRGIFRGEGYQTGGMLEEIR